MRSLGPVNIFANRHIVAIRWRTRWQLDFMPGRWRVLSYRRGIRRPGTRNLDLGRVGIIRYARFQETP